METLAALLEERLWGLEHRRRSSISEHTRRTLFHSSTLFSSRELNANPVLPAQAFDIICKHQMPALKALFEQQPQTLFLLNQRQLAKLLRIVEHTHRRGYTLFTGIQLARINPKAIQLHPDASTKKYYLPILRKLFFPKLVHSAPYYRQVMLPGLPLLLAIVPVESKHYTYIIESALREEPNLQMVFDTLVGYCIDTGNFTPSLEATLELLRSKQCKFTSDHLHKLSPAFQRSSNLAPFAHYVANHLNSTEILSYFSHLSPLQTLIAARLHSQPDIVLQLLTKQGLSLHEATSIMSDISHSASQ